jgi:hypothetical protein
VAVVVLGGGGAAAGVAAVVAALPYVAGVVAEDGDRFGAQVGADHEELVLQAHRSLGEGDPLAEEEVAAEHLVRGEALEEGRVLDRAALHIASEDVAGALHGADDLAQHDVGAVADGHAVEVFEGLGGQLVVLVDELDVLAAGQPDPDIAGFAGPAGVLLVDHAYVRVLCRQSAEALRGVVGRAVVDVDDLVRVLTEGLMEERRRAEIDVPARVVHRHHDADLERGRFLRRGTGLLLFHGRSCSGMERPRRRRSGECLVE